MQQLDAEIDLEADLSPEERQFCLLRVRGYSQTQAYRVAYDKPRQKANGASSAASQIAQRPRVYSYMKRLFREAKKSDIISHADYLARIEADWRAAKEDGNATAAASFARLVGQAIGALEQNINVTDERLGDEELLKRLAGHDPDLADRLQRMLAGRREFDA